MEVKARAKYLRMSPRKLALVADYVRGKNVGLVINDLTLSPKKGAKLMLKILKSAVSNAPDTVDIDTLFVKTVFVTGGGNMRRFMPRAQGRATRIDKKFAHVTLILDEK